MSGRKDPRLCGETPAEQKAGFASVTRISSRVPQSPLWLDEMGAPHGPEMLQAHVDGAHVDGAHAGAKQPESSALLRGQHDQGPQEWGTTSTSSRP